MAIVRSSSAIAELALGGASNLRSSALEAEIVIGGLSNARSANLIVEGNLGGTPLQRSSGLIAESLVDNPRNLRNSLVTVEVLIKILEERMSTRVFPTLRGLAFDVVKRPTFSNKVVQHTSGKETATAYWNNPRWDYTISFDWLPDKVAGTTDLKALQGFFLNNRANFDTWLYDDVDDNTVVNGWQKVFDGVSLEMPVVRGIDTFYEPVGQVRTDTSVSVWLTVTQSSTVPASPGPYTRTVTNSAAFVEDKGVTKAGVPMTAVASGPTTGQYSVSAGVYTFAAADQTQAIVITYRYLVAPAAYTVTMPNLIVFTVAPANGSIGTASFQYYFACRFKETMAEFSKFMNKLWELQQLNFMSVIQ